MSRPIDPSWVVSPWAPDVNYAAGALPWEGLATKVAWAGASSVGFTPKLNVPAQAVNYALNAAFSHHADSKAYSAALLAFVGQMTALNFWGPLAVAPAGNVFALFNPVTNKWYAGGSSDTDGLYTNMTGGLTSWSVDTALFTALDPDHESFYSGDVDTDGNMILGTSSRWGLDYDAGTDTWSKVDIKGSNGTDIADISYDPVADVWAWIADGNVMTSPDRAVWTQRAPGFTTAYTGPWRIACNKVDGKTVAIGADAADVKISTSSNGGVTWTLRTDISTTISPTRMGLSYSEAHEKWIFIVGEVSGTPTCEVWESSNDGATWTQSVSLNAACIIHPVAYGSMWVALAQDVTKSQVVYSFDAVDWFPAGHVIAGDPIGIYQGGGRVLALTSSVAYRGIAMGHPAMPPLV